MCHDTHLKSSGEPVECSYDNSDPESVSKQRKITENTNTQALGSASADMSALVSVCEPAVVDSCKWEEMEPAVVNSAIDFAGFGDDPSDFFDILKTINGCEFTCTSEFQKCLNESDRDDSNFNFTAGDLTCLSASDVTDAVTEKSIVPPHSSGENVPSAALLPFHSIPLLHGETNYGKVPPSAQGLPVDNNSVQLRHQNIHEPVMHHLQLLQTSRPPCRPESSQELLKHHQLIQMKQHHSLRWQLYSHDAHSLSRIQNLQQGPEHNQVPSCYPTPVSAQHLQQYEVMPEQRTWSHQDWQMPVHCVQQAQQQQFASQSVGMSSRAVKKEMSLSVIVSSAADAATGSSQQVLSSLSENAGHRLMPHACAAAYANVARTNQSISAGCQPGVLDCNQMQHPHAGFLVNQKGGYVNCRQVVAPEFCLPSYFMQHITTGQQFGEVNQIRVVAQTSNSACRPVVSGDVFVSAADDFVAN